jgi:hypothetical protein
MIALSSSPFTVYNIAICAFLLWLFMAAKKILLYIPPKAALYK